jgi:hypothetical protein
MYSIFKLGIYWIVIGFCIQTIAAQDSIKHPWSTIRLTGERMKPKYPFIIPAEHKTFPWLAVTGGTVGAGLATYLLLSDDSKKEDCTINATFNIQHASCDLPNGSVTALITPAGQYDYSWSNGSTGNSLQQIREGNYTLTVSKSGTSCTKVFSTSIQNNILNFQINLTTTNADCGKANGQAQANPAPAGNYSFQWSTGETSPTIQNLKPGHYQLTVSAGGNCTQITQFTILEKPATFNIQSKTTSASCGSADGSAVIQVEPADNYTYTWSHGHSGAQATGLKAGSYSVTVTLAGTSCELQHQLVIDELAADFRVTIETTPEYCNKSNGTATAAVDPPGNYLYQWSNGSTSQMITGLKSGTFELSITKANSECKLIQSFDIKLKNAEHSINVQSSQADCGLDNGQATIIVEPPGNYRIQWSDGFNGFNHTKLAAGSYSVSVTDQNDCIVQTQVIVTEQPASYIRDIQTSAGNCLGDHTDIRLELESQSMGPFIIQASGPNGLFTTQSPLNKLSLKNYIRILPGQWQLSIRDSSLKMSCIEERSIEVKDSSDFTTKPDSFFTRINKTLSANVLVNDTGISLKVISHTNPLAGELSLMRDGSFTFKPHKDTSGIFSFIYNVEDSCKLIKSEQVIIKVDSSTCEFSIKFTATLAHCGLADGSLQVKVDSPGTYRYIWNTGHEGAMLSKIPKGKYTVSITDEVKKCTLQFDTILFEQAAEYIRNLRITQPRCGVPGEIRFEVFSAGNGPMKLILDHPNGNAIYTVQKGFVNISSYANIVPGVFTISIYDESAGLDCMHEIIVTIEPFTNVEIKLEAVIPPSGPTASDGTALIFASMPGALPYVVLLNNMPYITAFDHFIEVGGLAVGTYTIQVRDANNCLSNRLTVVVLPRGFTISIGVNLGPVLNNTIIPERGQVYQSDISWKSHFGLEANYVISGLSFSSILQIPLARKTDPIQFNQLLDFSKFSLHKIHSTFRGGLGLKLNDNFEISPHLVLQLKNEYPLTKFLGVQLNVSLKSNPYDIFEIQCGLQLKNPFKLKRLSDTYRNNLKASIP